jgi:hypothetical protein
MPLTTDSICQNSGKTPLITNLDDIPQIRGFGLYSEAKYGLLNPYHTGTPLNPKVPLATERGCLKTQKGGK